MMSGEGEVMAVDVVDGGTGEVEVEDVVEDGLLPLPALMSASEDMMMAIMTTVIKIISHS